MFRHLYIHNTTAFRKERREPCLKVRILIDKVLIIALLLGPHLLSACSAITPPIVQTLDNFSFAYISFNTPTETVKALSQNYTTFGVKIDYEIDFNATTSEPKAIVKLQNTTSGTVWGLDITLFRTNIVDVNYVVGDNSTKLSSNTYTTNMIIYAHYDGAYWTVTDYNNASHIFLSKFACPNFTLRAVKASGEPFCATDGYVIVETAVPISAKAATFLLNYTYNSTLGLCSEESVGRDKSNVFWICTDNLLAYYALKNYNEAISDTIKANIIEYAMNYSLPTDANGLPITYKHEPILGDTLPERIPYHPIFPTLKNESSYVIRTEVNNDSEHPWTDWMDFADELAWQGMSFINQGKVSAANACYNNMMNMWDGYGFADKAFLRDGYYEPFKLALAIILRQRLNLSKPTQEETMEDVLWLCQQPNGGIATGYDRTLNTIGHVENTETTALVVIANVCKSANLFNSTSQSIPLIWPFLIGAILGAAIGSSITTFYFLRIRKNFHQVRALFLLFRRRCQRLGTSRPRLCLCRASCTCSRPRPVFSSAQRC